MENKEEVELTYKGGVLIVGSLLWDKSDIRTNWRNNNLNEKEKISLNLPIRYGRISKSRNCTYSMVYSSECKSKDKIGAGYFVPFNNVMSLEQIIDQSKILINAEHNEKKEYNRFHWSWGSLGIKLNPNLENNKEFKTKFDTLKKRWKSEYKNGFKSENYAVGKEDSILPQPGFLNIDWQEVIDEFDFVIGTATKPEVNSYPSPEEIALKMIINKDKSYFSNNIECSIKTFQDDKIFEALNKNIKLE